MALYNPCAGVLIKRRSPGNAELLQNNDSHRHPHPGCLLVELLPSSALDPSKRGLLPSQEFLEFQKERGTLSAQHAFSRDRFLGCQTGPANLVRQLAWSVVCDSGRGTGSLRPQTQLFVKGTAVCPPERCYNSNSITVSGTAAPAQLGSR